MSKQQLTVTASILAIAGKRDMVKQALLKLIPPTLAEKGCLNYDLHQTMKILTVSIFTKIGKVMTIGKTIMPAHISRHIGKPPKAPLKKLSLTN